MYTLNMTRNALLGISHYSYARGHAPLKKKKKKKRLNP